MNLSAAPVFRFPFWSPDMGLQQFLFRRVPLPFSLILRKREALSRRRSGTLRSKWPILREGPDGPPRDEDVFEVLLNSPEDRPLASPDRKEFRPIC